MRSEMRASQPDAGRAQCSVGSIDDDGIRKGFATSAWKAKTTATASTIVASQSTAEPQGGRSRPVSARSIRRGYRRPGSVHGRELLERLAPRGDAQLAQEALHVR